MDVKHKIGIIVMIGLPGSGKTTFVNALSDFINQRVHKMLKHDIHIMHYDKLIPVSVQSGNSDIITWKNARKEVLQQVETSVKNFKENISLNKYVQNTNTLIFIDDNMYYRSMRYEYFKLARSYTLGYCQFYMSCTPEEAIKNNLKRQSNAIPNEVIISMATKLQCPDITHNKWEQNSLNVTSNTDFDNAYKLIEASLNFPIPPINEKNVMESNPSLIHKVDLSLRKIVSDCMKNACGNKEQLRMLASSLNSLRRDVLEKFRAGDIVLPDNGLPEFLAQQMDCCMDYCSNSSARS